DRVDFLAGDGLDQRRGADFQRGAAGQSATKRHGRVQQHVQPKWFDPAREETGDDAARIIRPFGSAGFAGFGQVNDRRLVFRSAADSNFAVAGTVGGHDGVVFNRHRQNEAVVVIRVFADDVDAAGRGDDPARLTAIMSLKFSGDGGGAFLEVHTKIKIAPKKIILRRGESNSPVTSSGAGQSTKSFSICSSVLFLVSGSLKQINMKPSTQIAA